MSIRSGKTCGYRLCPVRHHRGIWHSGDGAMRNIFTALADAAAAIRSQTQMPVAKAVAGVNDRLTDNDGRNSIVGLWHIRFMIGPNTIQEAFRSGMKAGPRPTTPMSIPGAAASVSEHGRRGRTVVPVDA